MFKLLFIQRYTQCWFFRKDQGIVSPPRFVCDFSTKVFIMLYSINWLSSLSYCLYFLRYWTISFLQLFVNQVCDVINFKTLSFQSSCFYTWPKSQGKNLNNLRTTFQVKSKAFFVIFKGLSVARNCVRPYSAP